MLEHNAVFKIGFSTISGDRVIGTIQSVVNEFMLCWSSVVVSGWSASYHRYLFIYSRYR